MTTVLAGADWAVRAEYDEACHVACLGCAAESGAVGVAGVWAIEHARRGGPGHDRFRAATRTHWHVVPRRPRPRPVPEETGARSVWADVVAGGALLAMVALAVVLPWV